MTLAQLPGYFTAAWFIEKFGRKFVLVTYLIGTAVSAVVFGNAETVSVLLISGMLLSFFNLGAWGALYAYTPEQYPAIIRGTGLAWQQPLAGWEGFWASTCRYAARRRI